MPRPRSRSATWAGGLTSSLTGSAGWGSNMAKRKAIPTALRRAVIAAAKGRCQACDGPTDEFEVDHYIPVALGGTNDLSNLQALCPPCHKLKTKKDVKDIAKSNRIRAKRLGTKPKRWKKKVDGRAVFE